MLESVPGDVPLWNWALQAAGLCAAYAGTELNARRMRSGFAVWIVSNVALAALHAATGLWLLLALDLLFFRVNVIGLRSWEQRRGRDSPAAALRRPDRRRAPADG